MAEAQEVTAGPVGPLFADFRIVSKLGEGAMGTVYYAHQLSLDRPVALKVLAAHVAANSDFVERFYREARISAKLDHPNIVRGLAVGTEGGLYYFAMELVEGESVDHVLGRRGKLPIGDAVKIVLDVGRALVHAEAKGLVHRDIKPANIMVTRAGVVKLADLGLAKTTADDSGLTQTGVLFGTPSYMAPEQVQNAKGVDIRCDIYALGVTLYHLVTGQKPFSGKTMYDMLAAKEKGQCEPARRHNPDVPRPLERVIDRMMAPDPNRRYATAAELVSALEATHTASATLSFLSAGSDGSQVTVTAPPSVPPRRGRAASGPLRLTLLAALALALAGGGYALWRKQAVVSDAAPPAAVPIAALPAAAAAGDAPRVNRFLTRAFAELGGGDAAEAHRVLSQGLERYPGAAVLERALAELERGTLVLFQFQTPEETAPLAAVWSAEGVALSQQDNYRFAVVTSSPCFLYAFQVDERPSVSRVFPNPQFSTSGNPLRAAQVYWLPEEGKDPSQSWMHLDDFVGTERIYFVALTKPLRDPDAVGEQLLSEPAAARAALRQRPGEFVSVGATGAAPCFTDGAVQEFTFRHQ